MSTTFCRDDIEALVGQLRDAASMQYDRDPDLYTLLGRGGDAVELLLRDLLKLHQVLGSIQEWIDTLYANEDAEVNL